MSGNRGSRKQAVKTWSTPVRQEQGRPVPCVLCGGNRFRPHFSCEGFSYVRCTRCGLVQINPQPLTREVQGRYRESCGGDYLSYERSNEGAFLCLQELALRDAGFYDLEKTVFAAPSIPLRALDIGCATGALLAVLRDRGWDVRGIEISTQEAEYARRERGLTVTDIPLEKNNFPPRSFGVVLASHLIEHLNDPGAFVREVHRILAPGGRFFVTTPNIDGFQARLFGARWRSAIFDHLYLFSVKTLGALLKAAGFRVERIATWGGLAAGTAPAPVKGFFDRGVKKLGLGDVMIIRGIRD